MEIPNYFFQKLKFEMSAPTPIHFLRRFSKAAQADGQTHTLSKYFIELAAIDYSLSEHLPSEVSFEPQLLSILSLKSKTSKKKKKKSPEQFYWCCFFSSRIHQFRSQLHHCSSHCASSAQPCIRRRASNTNHCGIQCYNSIARTILTTCGQLSRNWLHTFWLHQHRKQTTSSPNTVHKNRAEWLLSVKNPSTFSIISSTLSDTIAKKHQHFFFFFYCQVHIVRRNFWFFGVFFLCETLHPHSFELSLIVSRNIICMFKLKQFNWNLWEIIGKCTNDGWQKNRFPCKNVLNDFRIVIAPRSS